MAMTPRRRSSGVERRQAIEGAALLVGGGELQVLELEPDLAAVLGGQRAARIAGRLDDRAFDHGGGALDVRKCDVRLPVASVLHSVP